MPPDLIDPASYLASIVPADGRLIKSIGYQMVVVLRMFRSSRITVLVSDETTYVIETAASMRFSPRMLRIPTGV
jgi:hypothetical protein